MDHTLVRERLEGALRDALQVRDLTAASALRSAIAALDNAQAIPAPAAPGRGTGGEYFAGSVPGLAAAEAPRRSLTDDEVAALMRAEVAERLDAARHYQQGGYTRHAERLQREAEVVMSAIGATETTVWPDAPHPTHPQP